jgi:DNA sulfur modification protein DndC
MTTTARLSAQLPDLQAVQGLIADGVLFVVNHSGGKDSQAMMALLTGLVPASQLLVVHAVLEEVEWEGVLEHIQGTIGSIELIQARPASTFFQMVDRRQMFPSPKNRQCTSDLKRGPIEREIRRFLAANPQFGGRIVNCMGMRAQESSSRAKLTTLKPSAKNSVAGRTWFDWLPLHNLTETEVFTVIAEAGQKPHWAYGAGMTRLSCCFCIMASQGDLRTAARLNPVLYARMVAKEKEVGHTLSMLGKGLEEVTGIAA